MYELNKSFFFHRGLLQIFFEKETITKNYLIWQFVELRLVLFLFLEIVLKVNTIQTVTTIFLNYNMMQETDVSLKLQLRHEKEIWYYQCFLQIISMYYTKIKKENTYDMIVQWLFLVQSVTFDLANF